MIKTFIEILAKSTGGYSRKEIDKLAKGVKKTQKQIGTKRPKATKK